MASTPAPTAAPHTPWWRTRSAWRLKRAFDVFASAAGLVVLSPILLGAVLAIWFTMGRPALFRQERPGYQGRPFTLYKFRTMRAAGTDEVWFRSDSDRLTRLGALLRRTSIDELPELWNVLRGEMSLVGPRPLLVEYLEKYTEDEMRRHDTPPGITGWAQVNGRQNILFSERFRLDLWYVDNWSMGLDLRILFRTVADVFRHEGVIVGQDVDDVDDLGMSSDRQREPSGDDGEQG